VNLRWHSLLRICRGGVAAGILWVTPVPQAQEVKAAEATGEESIETELPPPPFAAAKHPIPAQLLKDKKENWYVTGIPLIGLDPEEGFGVGAELQIYDDGPADSPFFRYAPYRRRITAGAVATTKGTESFYVGYDQPYINDSPWRIRAYAGWFGNKFADYFGTGTQTLQPLSYPGSTQTYQRFDDYQNALDQVVNGETWKQYNHYQLQQVLASFNVEYDLLGGRLRPLVGVQLNYFGVKDYTGDIIDGAVMQETKLQEDARLGRISGMEGGWDNNLRIGLSYDTRDYEPNPTSGILAQAMVTGSTTAIGSGFNYGTAILGFSHFTSLMPSITQLVLAGNYLYADRFGDVPFYALNRLSLPSDELKTGLGGWKTLRGYHRNRFVGDVTALATWELRWSFAETTIWKQHLHFMVAGFGDTGRVFDNPGSMTLRGWKFDVGGGLRLAWNLATVISFEYGVSEEGGLFYMELGHQF
jgi:outer membrane protein assembly factor BamA